MIEIIFPAPAPAPVEDGKRATCAELNWYRGRDQAPKWTAAAQADISLANRLARLWQDARPGVYRSYLAAEIERLLFASVQVSSELLTYWDGQTPRVVGVPDGMLPAGFTDWLAQ